MKLQTAYETKLQTAQRHEISAILDAKLESSNPHRLADYIGLVIDNLEATKQRFKDAESELKAMRADIESQIELIKEGVSEYLKDVGLDKLKGDIVSSISVYQPAPKKELIVTDEEHLINIGYFKTVLDKTAVKKALEDGEDIDGASIVITHKGDSLKINKKRK